MRVGLLLLVLCAAAPAVCQQRPRESVFREMDRRIARLEERRTASGGRFWICYDSTGESTHAAFFTDEVAPEACRGYGGPVPAAVLLSLSSLRITAVRFPPNDETPSYAGAMFEPEFARQFIGKGAADAFEAGGDVDGISGATYTTGAVNRGIKAALVEVSAALRKAPLARAPARAARAARAGDAGSALLRSAVVVAFFIAAAVAWLLRAAGARPLLLAASTAVLGFTFGGLMLSAGNAIDAVTSAAFWSGRLVREPSFLLLVAGAVVTSVLFGRLYCGYVCPFGALSELLWTLNPKKIRVGVSFARRLRFVKYGVLGVLLLAAALAWKVDLLSRLEPFGATFSAASPVLMIGAVAILAICAFVFRFYCRFLCPLAAILEALALLRILRRRPLPRTCHACGRCVAACPAGAVHLSNDRAVFDPSFCFNCADCAAERKAEECAS